MPKTYENELDLVKFCIYYARHTREVYGGHTALKRTEKGGTY